MNKKTFRAKIESGICTTYGCISLYKSGGQYYYGRYGEKGRETEVFDTFADLWSAASHYFVYDINYLNRTVINPCTKKQNERWMRIHNLKLCKCDARISIKQKMCSFCIRWIKLDRNHQRYIRIRGSISPYDKYDKYLITVKQKRLITTGQEQALRLCHHEHGGLDQIEAAKQMGISRRAICYLLAAVKKVLPQYFPIITKLEAQIYHYYMIEGWEVDEIAEYIDSSPDTIYKTLQRAKAKGMFFTGAKGRIQSYDALRERYGNDDSEGMDAHIKQKF